MSSEHVCNRCTFSPEVKQWSNIALLSHFETCFFGFVLQLSQQEMLLDSAQMSQIQPSLLPGPQYHDSAIGYKHCIYWLPHY